MDKRKKKREKSDKKAEGHKKVKISSSVRMKRVELASYKIARGPLVMGWWSLISNDSNKKTNNKKTFKAFLKILKTTLEIPRL